MIQYIAILSAVVLTATRAQLIKQCTCQEIMPCKNGHLNSIIPCADKCDKYVTALGADYSRARQCLLNDESKIQGVMTCMQNAYLHACTNGTRKMLQKRYPESLKIAAMAEANRRFQNLGITRQMKPLIASGQKFINCVKSCIDKVTHNCAKQADCQLDLPPDNELVMKAIECGHQSGVNTESIRKLCNCIADSGINQLRSICPKLEF